MQTLMAELTPYLLAGMFGLIGWYLRDNAKQHQALVDAVRGLSSTISVMEQRIEEKVETHSRRFERFVVDQTERLVAVETRCSIEHGEMPERRKPARSTPVNWQDNSDVLGVAKGTCREKAG